MKNEVDILNETDKTKEGYEIKGRKSADLIISPVSNISSASKAKKESDEKSNGLGL